MWTSLRRSLPWLLPLLAATLAFGIAYQRLWSFLIDDVFISARYAGNFVAGHGMVFNVGERVEGYTNFLWTLVLAVPIAFGLGLVPFLKGAVIVCVLGTAWATWRLTRALGVDGESSGDRLLAVLPAVMFLVTPAAIYSAAEGLETLLFAFLLTLATVWFLEEGNRPEAWPRSSFVLVALGMTRPDGAAFGVLFVLLAFVLRRPAGWTLRFGASFALGFGAYFALRGIYYGELFPNTFHAKSGGDAVLLRRGWEETVQFAARGGGWLWLAALPGFFVRGLRGPLLVVAATVACRLAFQLWSGGAWMGRMRFLVPALPLLLAMGASGLAVLARTGRRRAVAAVLAVATLVPAWRAYPREEAGLIGYGEALRNAHGAFGLHVAERTAPATVIAIDDAGLAPLLAERTTIDMLGLNDRHIGHLPGRFAEKFDVGYVLQRRPDLIVLLSYVVSPARAEDFRLAGHAAMFREAQFHREYAFARPYTFGAGYQLLVYRRRDSTNVPADF